MPITLTDITLDHPDVFCALTQFQHAGYLEQDTLLSALRDRGVPNEYLPKAPSQHVCLGRAVKSVASRNDRVESIRDGWVLTQVHHERLDLEDDANDGKNAHEVHVTAKVIKVGEATLIRITPENAPQAALIRHEYEYHQGQFKASEDLSQWLSRTILPWTGGVATRSRGGSYYIAKGTGMTRIRNIKEALDSVSSFVERKYRSIDDATKVFTVPTVSQGTGITLKPEFKSLDAVRIMLNGVIEATDAACDELHVQLTKERQGKRGLKAQITKCEDLEGKLAGYSKALGLDLGDMNDRLAELKAGLGMALLKDTDL